MSDQELNEYIKKAKEAGQTDEYIKNSLLNAGWKVEDIDAALSPIPEYGQSEEKVITFTIKSLLNGAFNIYKNNFLAIAVIAFVFLGTPALLRLIGGGSVIQTLVKLISTIGTLWIFIVVLRALQEKSSIVVSDAFSKSHIRLIIPAWWVSVLQAVTEMGIAFLVLTPIFIIGMLLPFIDLNTLIDPKIFWSEFGVLGVLLGIPIVIALLSPSIYVGVLLFFAGYSLVLENQRGLNALLRSRQLVKDNWRDIFVKAAIVVFILGVVGILLPLLLLLLPEKLVEVRALAILLLAPSFLYSILTIPFGTIYLYLIFSHLANQKPLNTFDSNEKRKRYKALLIWGALAPFIIIAATAFIVIFNPAKLFKYNADVRDHKRLEDIGKLQFAVGVYLFNNGFDSSICKPKTLYSSAPIEVPFGWTAGDNMDKDEIDGNGWVPVDFRRMRDFEERFNKELFPFNKLPTDPLNNPKKGFVYTFACDSLTRTFEFNVDFEDPISKIAEGSGQYLEVEENIEVTDGGDDPRIYEIGTNLSLINFLRKPDEKIPVAKTPKLKPTISDWETYEKYNYSFQYPPELEVVVNESKDGILLLEPPKSFPYLEGHPDANGAYVSGYPLITASLLRGGVTELTFNLTCFEGFAPQSYQDVFPPPGKGQRFQKNTIDGLYWQEASSIDNSEKEIQYIGQICGSARDIKIGEKNMELCLRAETKLVEKENTKAVEETKILFDSILATLRLNKPFKDLGIKCRITKG